MVRPFGPKFWHRVAKTHIYIFTCGILQIWVCFTTKSSPFRISFCIISSKCASSWWQTFQERSTFWLHNFFSFHWCCNRTHKSSWDWNAWMQHLLMNNFIFASFCYHLGSFCKIQSLKDNSPNVCSWCKSLRNWFHEKKIKDQIKGIFFI